ncbi:MAG: asparagine synthase (glutamine-hydrolyzing) [Candidatus Omnitrophica bacterium]|nr:asparagine synthase (glutamine-hydrolyzing) [Candidatus Omnitrophota bacterium]
MCGIAGYLGSRTIDEAHLTECLALMGRRGPDYAAAKSWALPGGRSLTLLHTRLNIIDLHDRANQPLRVGSKWIAYNGELYNYVELREQLAAEGIEFTTTSDTEVLLRAIDRWGWEALDRCEGMWALAVYDEAERSLTVCRDRFGEKPLYVVRDGDGLYFGSEVKFLVALRGRPLTVNAAQLQRYLVNGYKSLYKSGQTFFNELTELPPATRLCIDAEGRESSEAYWELRARPEAGMSYEEAVAGVRERLIRSVELRLRSDVPLAFCLSGGVDSNALIGIARRVLGADVRGFTIRNTDARYDEGPLVDHAVRELGIRHTWVPTQTEEFLPRLQALVNHHDAPVYTITYYAHWLLMEQIASYGYRIAISGTAADELFTGYYDHHLAYLYEVRGEPALHAASREAWRTHVQPVVRNPYLRDPDLFLHDPAFRRHIFLDAEGFAQYLAAPRAEPFTETAFSDSLLRNRMLNELFVENVPVILHEDDLNAMSCSIENRSPYLDRALVEFAYRIPSRHLVRDGFAKAVLRDAMEGLVPEPIRRAHRKVGFNAPIHAFLDVRDPHVRRHILSESPIFEFVKRDRVAALMDKADLPNSESKFLFYVLSSKYFLERFGS